MTVDVQAVAPCRQKLIITVPADETRGPYDEIIAMFTRNGNPPGFRAGKAPRHIIERHYRAEIDKEVKRSLVAKFYHKALEQEKIAAVDIVDVASVLFSPATGATFTVTIDTVPEFKLPQYKGIPAKVEETAVTERDVDESLEHMRRSFADYADVADGSPAQKDDIALIDYEGSLDGKPLAEAVPNLPLLAGAKGHPHVLGGGNGALPPAFDDALTGARAGETVAFDAAFEPDFYVPALQGATVKYTATLQALRRPGPMDDAALLEKIKFTKGIEAFRANLRANLEQRAAARARDAKFQVIAQHLDARCKFDLPKIEAANEVNRAARDMVARYIQGGATSEQIEENRDALLQSASSTAERRLRMRYILTRIASEEGIEATDQEVEGQLQAIAYENRQPVEKVRAELEKKYGSLEVLRLDVRIQKTVDLLVNESVPA